jgi:protein involved in polysaccharide export with SLBB domain
MNKLLLCLLFLIVAPVSLHAQDPAFVTAQTGDPLQPGDKIRLWIWRESDMSGDFIVDANGEVVFPRIGPKKVTGVAPAELKQQLIEAYRVFLRSPSIEVMFLRRISVSGEVYRPGLHYIEPTHTVGDVIVFAGGVTRDGRPDMVQLRRNGEVIVASIRQGERLGDMPIRSGDQLFVPAKPWITRNPETIAGIVTAAVGLVTTVIVLLVTKN